MKNKKSKTALFKNIFGGRANTSPRLSHVAIALISCAILVAIVQWERGMFNAEFREGDIATVSIYAPYDFNIKGDIDNKLTDEMKAKALSRILPVYFVEESVQEEVPNKTRVLFEKISGLKDLTVTSEQRDAAIKELAQSNNIQENIIRDLLDLKEIDIFMPDIINAIDYVLKKGMISTGDIARLKEADNQKVVVIFDKKKGVEAVRTIEELLSLEDVKKFAETKQIGSAIKERKDKTLFLDLLSTILAPNILYDQIETEARHNRALAAIQPVYNIIEVKKNELILNKGERVTKAQLSKIQGIKRQEPYTLKVGQFFGIAILIVLFLLLVVLYIEFYEPKLIVGNKELIVLSTICILIVLAAKVIVISPWPSTLIPVSAASMLIAILLNSRLAIISACLLSILIGILSGNRLDITILSIVGSMVGIFAVRDVRRRSQLVIAGVSVGFANMAYLISMGLTNSLEYSTYLTESFLGFFNGMISAVIVAGILPIFESIFKMITDISLLELGDLNHPLLKEMVIKAPGTYHHSLVVGNLAEAVCESIGANPLLARVSAYFHDIGKIEKAQYFSENQTVNDSIHDKLSPTMSSLIITNHVKNGVELAEKYGLNEKIIDIIKQHHGTGLVFYFFKRALENTQADEIKEEGFRYPGPKPQTKEAACVLLADSVEAASRSLDEPTPSSIKGLVRKIINNKFIDGQLDECDLTLKDLEKIADIFTRILTGIYHSRIEYPEDTGRHK